MLDIPRVASNIFTWDAWIDLWRRGFVGMNSVSTNVCSLTKVFVVMAVSDWIRVISILGEFAESTRGAFLDLRKLKISFKCR